MSNTIKTAEEMVEQYVFPYSKADIANFMRQYHDQFTAQKEEPKGNRVWDEEMNKWVFRPNKTIEEQFPKSQPEEPKEGDEFKLDNPDNEAKPGDDSTIAFVKWVSEFSSDTHVKRRCANFLKNYKSQPEEPKEFTWDYHELHLANAQIKVMQRLIYLQGKEIADLKSQIATLKAETFSWEQVIGFAEWLEENDWYIVHEGMHANEWSKRGFGVYKPTTDLLNEFLKQKP